MFQLQNPIYFRIIPRNTGRTVLNNGEAHQRVSAVLLSTYIIVTVKGPDT